MYLSVFVKLILCKSIEFKKNVPSASQRDIGVEHIRKGMRYQTLLKH